MGKNNEEHYSPKHKGRTVIANVGASSEGAARADGCG